tara:strand:- start:66 stop:326 length:261 start_codon:yes stop_codon:yes gene_type:complete
MKPYKDSKNKKEIIREFCKDTDALDLVWHRDSKNREVRVLEGIGWFFQRENSLPKLMSKGDLIKIEKEEWHRIIKGSTTLVVEIKE